MTLKQLTHHIQRNFQDILITINPSHHNLPFVLKVVCSGDVLFQRSFVVEAFFSKGRLFRFFLDPELFVPTVVCSEGRLFWKPFVPDTVCSEGRLFRIAFFPKLVCSKNRLFRKSLVPKLIFVANLMFYIFVYFGFQSPTQVLYEFRVLSAID